MIDAAFPLARNVGTLRGGDSAGLSVSNAVLDVSTAQARAPRADNSVSSRSADNWKRARIVGYTLGAIVVGVVVYVAYNVLTGT